MGTNKINMNVFEALEYVVSNLPIGPSYVLPIKSDIKEEIYKITGHYPRATEFDKALDALLKTNNRFNFGYECGWGWFRAENENHFKSKYNGIIRSNELKKQALTA